MNKRSSQDTKVKQQHTLVEFKAGCYNWHCLSFYLLFESAIQLHNFEIQLTSKESMPFPGGRNGPCAYVDHTCNVRLHAECLHRNRHPTSESWCSASIPDRCCRLVLLLWPSAGWARSLYSAGQTVTSSSISAAESSEQLPSFAPRWPHSESLGPGCATTWPAVRWRIALHSSLAGVAFRRGRRADGCLPSGGRARSESVSASLACQCAMVSWALSNGLIDRDSGVTCHSHIGRMSRSNTLDLRISGCDISKAAPSQAPSPAWGPPNTVEQFKFCWIWVSSILFRGQLGSAYPCESSRPANLSPPSPSRGTLRDWIWFITSTSTQARHVHLESCTPGQDWAKWYILARTSTYQYVPVQHSTRQYENLTVVCTGTYRYVLSTRQVVFWLTQKESGGIR